MPKGFKEARSLVIASLRSGNFLHEEDRPDSKNYLFKGQVTADDVIALLILCRGTQYTATAHHQLPCQVHVFVPVQPGTIRRWYIKVYFLSDLSSLEEGDPDVMFISVHPSE